MSGVAWVGNGIENQAILVSKTFNERIDLVNDWAVVYTNSFNLNDDKLPLKLL